jgi:PadR family transcriptional regulator, regulatory protein PadR
MLNDSNDSKNKPATDGNGSGNEPGNETGQNGDLVQGTLEMLILKTLQLEPMHGYGVALRIEQISNGVFRVNPGSLLPALSRMERGGRVKSEWRATENNRRAKYYLLTASGRKALEAEMAQWERQTAAIGRILEA